MASTIGPITPPSSGGSGTGAAIPIATPGFTVDTTTYDDPVLGDGTKLTTLVFPADPTNGDQIALAIAMEGDAFPRWYMLANPESGLVLGDGTADPYISNTVGIFNHPNGDGTLYLGIRGSNGGMDLSRKDTNYNYYANVGSGQHAFRLPYGSGNGGGNAASLLTGAGEPVSGGYVGDVYVRSDGGDGSWIYRCTTEGPAGTAVWEAKL